MEPLDSPKLKPQFIPIRCPVCKGFGSVNYGQLTCKACGGLGYIKVPPGEGEVGGREDDRYR